MRKLLTVVVIALGCAPLAARADDVTWRGVATDSGSQSDDTNLAANYDTATVPTTGDSALFILYGGDEPTVYDAPVYIDAGDTNFNPDGDLFFNGNAGQWYKSEQALYVDKNLSLNDLIFTARSADGGSGGTKANRVRIGTLAPGVTMDLAGIIDVTNPDRDGDESPDGYQAPGWGALTLGYGDSTSGSGTVINMTGDATFADPGRLGSAAGSIIAVGDNANSGAILQGHQTIRDNADNTKAPQINFTGTGATIDLAETARANGILPLGYTELGVRSDQTWNADPLSYIARFHITGDNSVEDMPGPYLIESLDGGRLDNLGGVNILFYAERSNSANATTGMRLHGGTYGGLYTVGRSAGRAARLNMQDDVTFSGSAIQPASDDGLNPAVATPYSVALRVYTQGESQMIDTQGFALTLANGLELTDQGPASYQYGYAAAEVEAEGSTVVIGGDVVMTSINGTPDAAFILTDARANGSLVLDGGSAGADVTVGGSWDVQVISGSANRLANSTLTMSGDGVTFEVADASTQTGVSAGSWAINILNIGNGVDAANVQLVNDYLNDNTATGAGVATDRDGEKLIVNTLSIAANATLDVNGQAVEISSTTLNIDAAGVLDLNTGLALVGGELISNFVGLTDQTAAWNALASLVIDSSNPDITFAAVLDAGNTVWEAQAAGPAVLLGDANNDGVVSADDFAAVQTNFGNTGAADGLLPGDANDDGVVSADDFAAIQTNFGNVLGAATEAAPVPEPATLALLALGGLAAIRRKRG